MDIVLLIVAVAIPLWLNVKATVLVYRDDLSGRARKTAQLLFIWLVPLLGAIIVLGVHRQREKPSGMYADKKDPIDDLAILGRSPRSITETVDGD